jgi:glycosyltransferase involved in cell wall biosynthesis
MDRANYELAWYLAETAGRTVLLVGFSVAEPLASHARVRWLRVARPWGRTLLGRWNLWSAGRHAIREVLRANPRARVVVNGGNCPGSDINWVHMVHHACPAPPAEVPLPWRWRSRLAQRIARASERRCVPASRLVIANSEMTRRHLAEHLGLEPSRVPVLYLGCDPQEHAPISPAEREQARGAFGLGRQEVVLGFVGALGWDRNKGFDVLVHAARRLTDQGMPIRVLAAGGGALGYWQRYIAQMGLTGRVQLLGRTSEVRRLLAACDLVVGPSRYDAYGLALHEALCCELPVIVSSRAGISERIPAALRDCVLPDPDDAADLARRIQLWHARRDCLGPEFARLGRTLRQQTWHRTAQEFVALAERSAPAPHLAAS